jgi:hypothetical protein
MTRATAAERGGRANFVHQDAAGSLPASKARRGGDGECLLAEAVRAAGGAGRDWRCLVGPWHDSARGSR